MGGGDARILQAWPFCLKNHFISQEALLEHFDFLIIYYSVYFSCFHCSTVNAHLIFAIGEADSSRYSVFLLHLTVQLVLPVVILQADKG